MNCLHVYKEEKDMRSSNLSLLLANGSLTFLMLTLGIHALAIQNSLCTPLMVQPTKYNKAKEMNQDPKDGQQIVRIIDSRGNNLEVETADTESENFLVVTMPIKEKFSRLSGQVQKITANLNVYQAKRLHSKMCRLIPQYTWVINSVDVEFLASSLINQRAASCRLRYNT
uniref:Uncharacterized protein n=1 Tax=Glossina palpalis gambiensis TaxID=67801 RepID=A0A1B0BYP3_9MUSC